ncbi:ribosome small subunit-dependent GTPase A [uncultured Phascolarctobacterium sp.]|uniref:ribosome small subunit-dependent GTPase A n=1 Tax=uncultured Phascolarctobacterium sp. TaxID=512296 RepID=UPI00260225B8|nr:ribosome small subunit-dependent GTPase A [uncultured Phascolarctobacterium sp.]
MAELQGLVLKNYNGYYYVQVGAETYTCKIKGKMKQRRFSLVTGDRVLLEAENNGEGMIKNVLPRKNFLPRPTMSNLDLFVAAFACAAPDFSFLLADKLLALAELAQIPAILVLNKADQAPKGLIEQVKSVYEPIGYEVYAISATEGTGIAALKERLRGKLCAFGGPSGAGKSSTINAIDNSVDLRTGAVSEKIGRGRHTTRFAQLLPFDEGYIADTPGFGNLLLEGVDEAQALSAFREFADFEQSCRFCPCSHTHEPVCGVKAAVASGQIAASRYASYLAMLEEIKLLKEKEGRKC